MTGRGGSVQAIELDLLLDALARGRGYDFRGYARASLRRRLLGLAQGLGCDSIAELIPKVLYDEALLPRIIAGISVPVSEFFRDPLVFQALAGRVLPHLPSSGQLRVWQAGCATGEEAYSLAILLDEAGLSDRAGILATDINMFALATAAEGLYPQAVLDAARQSHSKSGGRGDLSRRFLAEGEGARVADDLRGMISFVAHNLVSDGSPGHMDLILCRNVLIYFDRPLQDRVMGLFADSLKPGGFLCLGSKESLAFSTVDEAFDPLDGVSGIYRRR